MLERTITTKILEWLNRLDDCHAVKIHGNHMQGAGHPDILGCYRGRTLAIEVKQPGEQPTPLQRHELARWHHSGALCCVATSVGDVARLLGIGAPQEAVQR